MVIKYISKRISNPINLMIGFICVLIIAIIIKKLYTQYNTPHIDTIWVINLDKDKARMENVLKQQNYLPVAVQRWKAAYGKEENRKQIMAEGVQDIISRSPNNEENKKSDKVLLRAGEIGCWLSHKRLLTYLSKQDYPPNYGHLILEDDIKIDPDFIKKWNNVRHNVPDDWEMLYFGVGNFNGTKINNGVFKQKKVQSDFCNYGTYSYMVRHKSISKILEKLGYMIAPIDVQYYNLLDGMNIYILNPFLITATEDLGSSIDAQEKREYVT